MADLAITDTEISATEFPVSVVIERRTVTGSKWATDRWSAVAVLAGSSIDSGDDLPKVLSSDAESEQFMWGGYRLQLFRDDLEGYYFNLKSEQPIVFVICDEIEDGAGSIKPQLVTASPNEAAAYDEVSEYVYSVPMPPEIYVWVEHYVVENYVPTERKKRKRRNWKQEGEANDRKA